MKEREGERVREREEKDQEEEGGVQGSWAGGGLAGALGKWGCLGPEP